MESQGPDLSYTWRLIVQNCARGPLLKAKNPREAWGEISESDRNDLTATFEDQRPNTLREAVWACLGMVN